MQSGRGQQPFRGNGRARVSVRGRGRGRGRSDSTQSNSHGKNQRGASPPTRPRGRGAARGRGNNRRRSNTPSPPPPPGGKLTMLPINPPPEHIKEYDFEALTARRTQLHERYEQYRKYAISEGLMSDDNQSSLEEAIRTVGTCTQMCDEKERVNRIYEGQTDAAERLPAFDSGASTPVEGHMVKKFRRSAAGVDKQIPQELRTPKTLQKTLDYLFNELIGKHRLGQHHKFIWDRTRAIRNDFSIQSLTDPSQVKYEIDCYEKIIRFHILSAHQLSNPDNLIEGEHFEHQQELEQLQKTFQSLMDKYDVFRGSMKFPHEAEFRAYYIIFSPILVKFDFEIEVQTWPDHILKDGRVQTALSLLAAMGSPDHAVGSTNVGRIPVAISQANVTRFWSLIDSKRVGYLMACVAEISFQRVRYTALNAIWKTAKSVAKKAQGGMKHWTKTVLAEYLAFDNVDDLEELCERFGVSFDVNGEDEYLDFQSRDETYLDNPFSKPEQLFSNALVETKRHGRALVAVLNGMSIARARQEDMIEDESEFPVEAPTRRRSNMFVGDQDDEESLVSMSVASTPGSNLNPAASVFEASAGRTQTSSEKPAWMTSSGSKGASGSPTQSLFGQKSTAEIGQSNSDVPQRAFKSSNPFSVTKPQTTQNDGSDTASSAFQSSNPFSHAAIPPSQDTGSDQATPELSQSASKSSNPFSFPKQAVQDNHSDQAPLQFIPKTVLSNGKTAEINHCFATNPFPTKTSTQSPIPKWPSQGIPSNTSAFTPSISISSSNPFTQATPATLTSRPEQIKVTKPIFADTTIQSSDPRPQSDPKPISQPIFNFAQPTPTSQSLQQVQSSETQLHPSGNTIKSSKQNFAGLQSLFDQSSKSSSHVETPSILFPPSEKSRPVFANTLGQQPVTTSKPANSLQFGAIINSSSTETTTPLGSPVRSRNEVPKTTPPDLLARSRSAITQQPIRQELSTEDQEPFNKEEVLTQLCRLSLVQEQGTLDMFVSYKVASIVKDTFEFFTTSKRDRRMKQLKRKHLSRKYVAKWQSAVIQRRLQRRAVSRRNRIAATIEAAREKEERQAREMKDIMQAKEWREQMRAEQKQKAEEDAEKKRQFAARIAQETQPRVDRKRKMATNGTSSISLQGIAISPAHKRSRTLGSSSDSDLLRASVRNQHQVSSLSDPLNLRRSISQKNLRQSLSQQKVDRTKTDYFTLKAYGVDPSTPFIPETKDQVDAREQREEEHRRSVTARVLKRRNSRQSHSSESSIRDESPLVDDSPIVSPQPIRHTLPTPRSQPASTSDSATEDPFLKSLRKARQLLEDDSKWFANQTVNLGKEIEQAEEFRRSRDSAPPSTDGSIITSNGFARSVNGQEYVPPILKSGQTLSRTELRIRQTGARGLATAPFGGTPGHSPGHSIPMSRCTASTLGNPLVQTARTAQPQASPKRSIDDVYQNGFDEESDEPSPAQQSKKLRQDYPVVNGTHDTEDDEQSEEEGDEEEEQEQEQERVTRVQFPEYGLPYEFEEDDESEEEEYDDGYASQGQYYGEDEGYGEDDEEGVPLPPRGTRGVSSVSVTTPDTGAGASQDAAIELSD